uniref:Uncharacterized protein n=1 Tax=Picea glauca TaxID=3330 RepID=A0A117NH03_PICGL|nr:hypothetical protein ABT39_MTgene5774 [Picea glauca]
MQLIACLSYILEQMGLLNARKERLYSTDYGPTPH